MRFIEFLTENWRHPQGMRRSNPTAEVSLVLQHPRYTGAEDDYFAELMAEVEFTFSPADPSVGWRGGPDEIQSVTAAEPFDFMGHHVETGQEIPEEMLKFWSPSRGYKQGDVYDYLLDTAAENVDGDEDDGDYEYERRRDREFD